MATPPCFLFFCAGGHRTGLGHLVRSRVLCAAAREQGYQASLLLKADDGAAPPVLHDHEGLLPTSGELSLTSAVAAQDALVVVIDAPGLDAGLLAQLRLLARTLVLVSPIFQPAGDSVIDVALTRVPVKGLDAHTQQEFGLEYAVFQQPKQQLDTQDFEGGLAHSPPRVGVCFGGSDPENLTREILKHLRAHHTALDISIVLGPSFRHFSTLVSEVDDRLHRIELYQGRDSPWDYLGRCRAVLLGGGLMALEAASLGLPAVHLARNLAQRELLEPLERAGAALVCPGLGAEGAPEAARMLARVSSSVPVLRRIRAACESLRLSEGAFRTIRRITAIDEQNSLDATPLG